jgi:hypothetical protein
LAFTIYYLFSGHPVQAVILNGLAVIFSVAGLVSVTFFHRTRPAAHAIILGIYTALIGPGVFTGGIDSSALVWLIFVPFVAALTAGLRASFVWSVVTMLSVIILFVLKQAVMIDYTVRPSGSIERFVDLGCAIVAMTIAIWANETIKKRMVDQLAVEVAERSRSQEELRLRNQDLERALADIKQLSGMLPICASCKKIRNDKGYWEGIEAFLRDHSDVQFSHGICPECAERLYPDIGAYPEA